MGLIERISTFLSPRKNKPRREAAPAIGLAPDMNSPEFTEKLRHLLGRSRDLIAGGVHVINVRNVRDHFGEEWPKVAVRAEAMIRDAIERRLDEEDVYAAFQDTAFVIVFARLPKNAAEIKCALIAEEISQRLLGDAAGNDVIEVAASVVTAEGKVGLKKLRVRELLAAAAGGGKGGPGDTRDAGPSPDWQCMGNRRDAIEEYRTRLARELLSHLPPREKKLYSRGPLEFVYRPMWLVKHKVTSAHTCIPARVTSDGTSLVGGAALLSSPGNPVNALYDLASLKAIGAEMEFLESQGRSVVLVAPVHFISLSERRLRDSFLDALRRIPQRFRERILFEIMSIPQGTPQGKLEEAITIASGLMRRTMVRVRLDNSDFASLSGLGVYAVGTDITNFRSSHESLIRGFDCFVEKASRYGLRTYIHGLHATALTSAAVCAGFDYVDGDTVTTVLDRPGENAPFGIKDIYGFERGGE